MKYSKKFIELNKDSSSIAGGKGASLGEMLNANIPVPDGFVILSDTFDYFIRETDLVQEIESILSSVNHNIVHTVDAASKAIQGLILSKEMPRDIAEEVLSMFKSMGSEFVAVRSSATAEDGVEHAWAGQLDSFLNTTEETLLLNVKKCWASLFTPRAIFYRFEKDLHRTNISVAVVVQIMINSEKSGIAFSVHPVTENRNQIIIEAGFGLGEAIVSGSITPDAYVIEKSPRKIIDVNVNTQNKALYRKVGGGNEWREFSEEEANKQVLSEREILELSDIIMTLENHYGFPCDIEWAYENETFHIVQSRPITTLKEEVQFDTRGIVPSEYHFCGLWKCNLLVDWFWAKWLVPEYAKMVNLDLNDGGILVINGGNFFVKEAVFDVVRVYAKEIIESNDIERLGVLKEVAAEIYRNAIPETKRLSELDPTAENVRAIAKEGQKIMFPWCFGYLLSEVFDEFLIPAAEKVGIKPEDIPPLVGQLETPLFAAQKELRKIKAQLENSGYWGVLLEDHEKALSLIGKDEVLVNQITKYISDYGWTTVVNLMGENPTLEQVIEQITHLSVEHEFTEVSIPEEISFLIECAKTTAYLRQTGVEYFSIHSRDAMNMYKKAAEKIGITFEKLRDLNLNEIEFAIQGENVSDLVLGRKGDIWIIRSEKDDGEPEVIDDKELNAHLVDKMIPKPEVNEEGLIVGQTGNKGLSTGTVKVITKQSEFNKMEKGDVLVTTMTTPDYVPLMQKANAIVTDIGGLLCHAAIISRELGVPCVIGTKFATQLLKDGDQVEVDANKGRVRLIKTSDHPQGEKLIS
jgi:phosphoenolpyruvate synthase/pyruvate phosphate dikinase